jgi:hypothetical protein
MISSGAAADIANSDGETPLHRACEDGRMDIVRLMIDSGANIDITDNDGRTPLAMATQGVTQVFNEWTALTKDQRQVILEFGREYYSMPAWEERRHQEYPRHLRVQAAALALCVKLGGSPMGQLVGNPLSLWVGAIDAHKRRRTGDVKRREGSEIFGSRNGESMVPSDLKSDLTLDWDSPGILSGRLEI